MYNKEHRKLWVKALRSGKYPQCAGVLRRSGERESYCCLGVLADLALPNGWSYYPQYGWRHLLRAARPADSIKEWAGLEDWYIKLPDPDRHRESLLLFESMNDDAHMTFPQIADIIEYFLIKEN